MIKKLRLKFVIVNMSIVVTMLVVIFSLVYHFTRTNLERESLHMMQALANRPFALGIPDTQSTMNQEIRLPYFILKVGPTGELLTTSGGYYDLSDRSFLDEMVKETLSSHKEFGVLTEYNLRFFIQERLGSRYIVFADISSETTLLEDLIRNCAIIGTLSFFSFLCISILLSKWAVRPVEMAWKQQRQFVADASHELKTPLTVILTNAELAESEDYTEADHKQFIKNIRVVSKHMKVLVEQMLELSRADQNSEKKSAVTFDFGKTVSNCILTFEAVLFEKGHPIFSEIAENIIVSGDEHKLRQVVEILLDNAGKYAAANGEVHVTLKKHKNTHCLLEVKNEGEPIPQEQLGNMFKRFYRVDSARNRDGSFGLGLSIAESIVSNYGGKIWAESKGQYNCFYVLLPCKQK